ncbi:hypothetical protein B0919_04965 [Hymenobacter sp. CRA2]|nr:hypothetical protein B0919_04965 [Hymenobacter sp. CRA2]
MVYAQAEWSDWFLLLFQLLIGLGLAFVWFLLWLAWWPWAVPFRRVTGALTVAIFLSWPLLLPIWHWQEQRTQHRAARIVQQLDAYRRAHGHYPDSLAQLAPHYLPQVPTTAQGVLHPPAFTYWHWPERPAEFALSYYAGFWVDATFSSQTRQWQYAD